MGFILPASASSYTTNALKVLPGQRYPMDFRLVVQTKDDLITESLWKTGVIDRRYDGMIVSVVQDSTEENNGVYSLRSRNDSGYFKSPQHPGGWFKIGENQQQQQINIDNYTIKDGVAVAQETDVSQPGLHVVRVDGGEFSSTYQ